MNSLPLEFEATYVLLNASNILCASLLTPLPRVASCSLILRIAACSRASRARTSSLAIGGLAFSKLAPSASARILKDEMCEMGTTRKSPGDGVAAVLMATRFVTGHAVKSVPSRTDSPEAVLRVMLTLFAVTRVSVRDSHRSALVAAATHCAPMAFPSAVSADSPGPAFSLGVATRPATLLRFVSAAAMLTACASVRPCRCAARRS